MDVIKAPHSYEGAERPLVFLAGSIEMGAARNWQRDLEYFLDDTEGTLLNPRRDDWDSSWTQDDPRFSEQVQWELQAMEDADLVAMHFEPGTQSPITLLELGLWAGSGKLVVSCPPEFWRFGNVRETCAHYGVPLTAGVESLYREVCASEPAWGGV